MPRVIAAGVKLAGIVMWWLKTAWTDIREKLREVGTPLRRGGRQVQGHMSGELRMQTSLTTFARSMIEV